MTLISVRLGDRSGIYPPVFPFFRYCVSLISGLATLVSVSPILHFKYFRFSGIVLPSASGSPILNFRNLQPFQFDIFNIFVCPALYSNFYAVPQFVFPAFLFPALFFSNSGTSNFESLVFPAFPLLQFRYFGNSRFCFSFFSGLFVCFDFKEVPSQGNWL